MPGKLGTAFLLTVFLGGICPPLMAQDRVIERVVTIVKEPTKTTKTITLDGELIFYRVWYKDGRHEGPGDLKAGPAAPSAGVTRPPAGTAPSPRVGKAKPRPRRTPSPRVRKTPTARPRPPAPPPQPRPAPASRSTRMDSRDAYSKLAALVGVPYRKGRSARSGSSCAGFTALACRLFGLHANEISIAEQARMGRAIPRAQVRLGDLVFFSNSPGRSKPDFGGIALSNGEMVYMSFKAAKAIRKDISTDWWRKAFVGARRIVEIDSRKRFVVQTPTPVPQTVENAAVQHGQASFYGKDDGFHRSGTASGEIYDRNAMTAAHKTLPMDSMVSVTNRNNGRKVTVRINDRGPYVAGRIIDLSVAAAKKLDMLSAGVVPCTVEVLRYGDGSR